jgi:hypothetical protein
MADDLMLHLESTWPEGFVPRPFYGAAEDGSGANGGGHYLS